MRYRRRWGAPTVIAHRRQPSGSSDLVVEIEAVAGAQSISCEAAQHALAVDWRYVMWGAPGI